MAHEHAMLALAAIILDDAEKVRIANENRYRQLTRTKADTDGEVRGFGLSEHHPDVVRLSNMIEMLNDIETNATKSLQRAMKAHPLGPFGKGLRGVGDKQLGRLLAVIGDPYIRPELVGEDASVIPEGPRSLTSLYAYCGLHVDEQGIAVRRKRGVKANWSNAAKTRTYVISESCIKQLDRITCDKRGEDNFLTHKESCNCSRYRIVYDLARKKYDQAIHQVECVRCGPKGKPALPGSSLSDGHKHMRGMRAVMKAILRDLYFEAKRIHTETEEPNKATIS